jgi:two-component system sensor histidine kinase CpxA
LLQDLVTTVNYETGETDQTIELELAPTLMLNADRELLWRAFENLLRNALVHAGGYGGIQVAASQTSENEIQVAVRDAGPGIAEHHIERVFEPFYRVDEARNRKTGGHGLGLAIAASAVRRHGGRISAEGFRRVSGGMRSLH